MNVIPIMLLFLFLSAPPHEHHVIALHKHGHHFGGLPLIFWISLAFLVIVFHLFLVKLIVNEYCQGQERFTAGRRKGYNVWLGWGDDCKIHSIRCQNYCSWLMLDCGIGATEYVVIDELWDQVPLTVFCVWLHLSVG